MNTFFTIGHSTRTVAEFVALLQEWSIDLVVDVRSMPRSRTNPQFNAETFPNGLERWQINYTHMAELGGLRGKQRLVEASLNAYWRVRGFRNYADYALMEPFTSGLAQLREQGSQRRCAIMCAETLWWRCHRRIIADYLLAADEHVIHILGASHIEEARLTASAVVRDDGTIIYPAAEALPQGQSRDA
jgi:uncharacterized protein (DUF488 family)